MVLLRLLSSDTLVMDLLVSLDASPELQQLMRRYRLQWGGKQVIDREAHHAFRAVFHSLPVKSVPGGSSANTLTTMLTANESLLEVTFLGVTGNGPYGRSLQESLRQAGIQLLPRHPLGAVNGVLPETPVSYVIRSKKGERTIATYRGNGDLFLEPELITEPLIAAQEIVFLQSSLYRKFSRAYVDTLFLQTRNHGKTLWLALPTSKDLSAAHRTFFLELTHGADVLLGNKEELLWIFAPEAPASEASLKKALRRVKEQLKTQSERKRREVFAFITLGRQGCVAMSPVEEHYAPSHEVEVINTLGAGDAAYAGFLAGHLLGWPLSRSAKLAMTFSAAKVQEDSARISDPRALFDQFIKENRREAGFPYP